MPLQTPPRRSRLRGRRGSARALPAGNTEAERDQRGGGDGEQDRELLAEQLRPAGGRKAGDGRKRDARSREHQRDAGQRRGQVPAPGGGENAGGDEPCRHEKRRDKVSAHLARSLARHAAAAPTRPTVTSTATASVASASCANRRRPRFAVPNVAP